MVGLCPSLSCRVFVATSQATPPELQELAPQDSTFATKTRDNEATSCDKRQKRQMTSKSQQKNEALRLHKKGMVPSRIAEKLKVSARTIQRWIKDEIPITTTVVAMQADTDLPQSITPDIEATREFDFNLSRRMAIRLLNLSESALDVVETTLKDPEVRRSDKLRAAKLVGDWLGLGVTRKQGTGVIVSTESRMEELFGVKLKQPQLQSQRQDRTYFSEGFEDEEEVEEDVEDEEEFAEDVEDEEEFEEEFAEEDGGLTKAQATAAFFEDLKKTTDYMAQNDLRMPPPDYI